MIKAMTLLAGLLFTTLVFAQESELEELIETDDSTFQLAQDEFSVEGQEVESTPEPELTIEEFLSFNRRVGENFDELKAQEDIYENQDHGIRIGMGKFNTRKELAEAKKEQLSLKLDKKLTKDESLAVKRQQLESLLQDDTLKPQRRSKLEARLATVTAKQELVAGKVAQLEDKIIKVDTRITRLEAKLAKYYAGELPKNDNETNTENEPNDEPEALK